jgi:hypothetical protein
MANRINAGLMAGREAPSVTRDNTRAEAIPNALTPLPPPLLVCHLDDLMAQRDNVTDLRNRLRDALLRMTGQCQETVNQTVEQERPISGIAERLQLVTDQKRNLIAECHDLATAIERFV